MSLRDVNMAARFLLEVGALGALGYRRFRSTDGAVRSWPLGLGAPLMAGTVWGLFGAPKAPDRQPVTGRLVLQTAVFAAATAALVANTGLMRLWRQ